MSHHWCFITHGSRWNTGCTFPVPLMKAMVRFMEHFIIRAFCPRAKPSLQAQAPRLQFCRRQIFHRKLRNQGCSFTRDLIGAVASRCFPHLSLSLSLSFFSICSDLKRSGKIPGTPTWRWGEWIWLTGPSGLHRNSPQGLNISSMRVFDQIRDLEIPITLRPLM